MPAQINQTKIENIEVTRGLASLGVCVVHMGMLAEYNSYPAVNYIVNSGQLGVIMFFIISGFIMPYSLYKNNYKINDFFRFIIKRSIRIDPPYYILLALTLLFLIKSEQINLKNIIYNIFYLVPFVKTSYWYDTIFWTLGIEIQFYIILGLCYPLLMKLKMPYLIIILLLCFHSGKFAGWADRRFILAYGHFFALGFLAFLVKVKKIPTNFGIGLLIFLCLEMAFLIAIRYVVICLFTILLIMVVPPIKNRIMTFLAKISYSLYLVHMLVASIALPWLLPITINPLLTFIVLIMISICGAGIYYFLVEQHFVALSRRLKYKRSEQ